MSQAQIKYIQSLSQQKYRKAYNTFLVEGSKNAKEWLSSNKKIEIIAALPEWLAENQKLITLHPEATVLELKDFELQKISVLKTAQSVLLVINKPEVPELPQKLKEWSLYLEEIKDPGNIGTILRIADWFGIRHIFHSEHCVEIYNPKVVQATMGSLLRVSLYSLEPEQLVAQVVRKDYPLYATTLDGENILKQKELKRVPGIIALGNESKGLSDYLVKYAHHHLKIEGKGEAESLNVGVAAGIFCALLTSSS